MRYIVLALAGLTLALLILTEFIHGNPILDTAKTIVGAVFVVSVVIYYVYRLVKARREQP